MKIKEAQATEIFVLDCNVDGELKTFKIGNRSITKFEYDYESLKTFIEVAKTNIYDFVMLSAEETTSPRGVEMKLHVRENEEEETWEVWSWGVGGNHPRFIASFESEEEAEDDIFTRTFNYDFEEDDQRDTCYYSSEEDAIEAKLELLSEWWGVSEDTAKSIIHHQEVKDDIEAQRESDRVEAQRLKREEEEARINESALFYSEMINAKKESYKETCTRLSVAIGSKIEKKVFHAAVKIIRKK